MPLITVEVLAERHDEHDKKFEVVLQLLKLLTIRTQKIMTTLAELPGELNSIKDTLTGVKTALGKIQTETQGLQANIQALTDALNNQGNVPPAVQIALDALKASATNVATAAQAIDELVPDAPVTPPDTGTPDPSAPAATGT